TGLLGLAFSPDWPTTKEFYIAYTYSGSGILQSRVSRIIVADDTTTPVTTAPEQVLLRLDQPKNNHNGGDIAFGTDGYLYTSFGDGGGPNDVFGNSQITTHLFSALLRIDVNGVDFPDPGYLTPPGNPFWTNPQCSTGSGSLDCPEIFAWGFRNPWRFSIDAANNEVWLGDVGQAAREEIDIVVAGGNYGWNCKEATINGPGSCSGDFIDPVHEYSHASGSRSVTGGYVYRGNEMLPLQGQYIFGDYLSGQVWALAPDGNGGYEASELLDSSYYISSFAQGLNGELFVTDYVNGGLHKLVSGGGVDSSAIPDTLSQNACVQASDPSQPVSGMIPYTPNAPFWSDGAVKSRWIGIPDGTSIDPTASTNWIYPNGTVAMKNFVVENKLVETRFFMRHPNGDWAGYTYEWNDAETEATRVTDGKIRTLTHTFEPQDWIYPSEDECLVCHSAAGGRLLGLGTPQLNGESYYPSTDVTDNQLETLNHINYFTADVPEPVAQLPALPDPHDISETIEDRARAYLHTNCASCHQPGSTAPVAMDLRYDTPLVDMNVCNIDPQRENLGLVNAKLIAPGDIGNSIIYLRMNSRDAGVSMPPIGSYLVDTDGVDLIGQWINQLSCN
ncbi:MAG: PQQ-dependent sugar dehydrogenase, partial [Pseudomonadales bacterium]